MSATTEKKNVILIIDENTTRKNNLSSKLRHVGYATELCSSGFHAVHLLEKIERDNSKCYRLILIIGDTADMPGREVLLLMRNVIESKNKLPILILHEDSDPDNILQTIKEGANDYIVDIENYGKVLTKVQKFAPIHQK
jgi:PleD family two-component response regulator